MQLIKTTLDKLKKGDIFRFTDSPFTSFEHRFHSYKFYSDLKKEWIDEPKNGCRCCVTFINYNYAGEIENAFGYSFKWQDKNDPSEITVYIVQKFKVSTSPKHSGKLYYQTNTRHYIDFKINPINLLP